MASGKALHEDGWRGNGDGCVGEGEGPGHGRRTMAKVRSGSNGTTNRGKGWTFDGESRGWNDGRTRRSRGRKPTRGPPWIDARSNVP
eukprot:scaffold17_cov354-Pavlova_lutheri.AAC.12